MDVKQWKIVLLEWIKSSELIDVFGAIEHVQINEFFYKFYYKLYGKTDLNNISNFLKENFPNFEILYDDTNNISSQDYVYIFSLLLYFSCVIKENDFFQKCCRNLNSMHQIAIVSFFEYLRENSSFSKESLRLAIKQINLMPSPQKSSNIFNPSPRKSEQQLIPLTPNKEFVNQKLKELKSLKTQLDNEKFEKSMMEVEMRQNQEKIDHLIQKCKTLNHDVHLLKTELLLEKEQELVKSPSKNHRENQLHEKMQKEIQMRDDLIAELKYENENITGINMNFKAKINVMEKQMREMCNKIRDMDTTIEELQCSEFMKDEKIKSLEEEKKDLLDFINENRCNCKDNSISSDILDLSGSVYHTINDSDLGENLAKSVIEVQLKEKDIEVNNLKEIIAELELKLTSALKTIDENLVKCEQLEEDLNVMTKEKDLQMAENVTLKTTIEKIKNENKKLHKNLETAQKKVKNETTARLSIEIVLEQERKTFKNFMENFDKLKSENDKIKTEMNSKKESNIKNLENQLIRKEKEISELIAKFEELLGISSVWRNERDQLIEEKKILEENEIKLIEKMKNLETEMTKSLKEEQKISSLHLKNEIEQLKHELRTSAEMNKNLQTKIQIEEDQKIEKDSLMNEIQFLKCKITEKENDLRNNEKLKEDHQNLLTKLENYKSQEDSWNKERKSLQYNIELLKVEVENGKKEVREAMEVVQEAKLESLKEKMKGMFGDTLENLSNKNRNLLIQVEDLKIQLKNRRNLEAELANCKKDNDFLLSKLRFSDKNFQMDALTGSIGMKQKSTSDICEEKFDNAYLNDLKLGTPFDEFLKNENGRESEALSYSDLQTERLSVIKPTKRKLSMSSFKNAFKFTTNNSAKKKNAIQLKSIVSQFSWNKNENRNHRKRNNNRTLTPKNIKECDKKWIIDRVDNDDEEEGIHKTTSINKKEIEFDRKMKREMERDKNRPNLNCDETVPNSVIEDDSDWVEDEALNNIKFSTPKCNKSMKYLRNFPSSAIKKTLSARTSDGLEKYQSCRSLNSESSHALTPTKSCTRNFVDTHIAVVNRMSDYTVPPRIRELKDDHYKDTGIKTFTKSLKMSTFASITAGFLYSVYNIYFR
ncbi:hypothetical protein PVAND_016119 [Polypedilum vanderplanki]|uniref:Uncharacterized protein n=1 Tax=Polypedilum vanderplanki TaxID=319348 RepID=A0A9J6BE63_POLVA|nr:hypothetical protein PVAND_016119 [Polypedilum vanderplanki]